MRGGVEMPSKRCCLMVLWTRLAVSPKAAAPGIDITVWPALES